MADGIIVGVDRPRPVARGNDIACAFGLVGSEAPVVAERFQIAQPLRMCTGKKLKRTAGPLVKLGPARQQDSLVNHLVHESVREPIAIALASLSGQLDQIGSDQAVESLARCPCIGGDRSEERFLERYP